VIDSGHLVVLGAAAFLAGAVNAVAGGGSLISFPALLAVGYPSVTANVTNAVAVLPGYIGGSHGYRHELDGQGDRIRALGIASVLGALTGAALLLVSSQALFDQLVPWLVLFSCALLVGQPRLAGYMRDRAGGESRSPVLLLVLQFAAAVYGGYFGAGLGILMFALLGIFINESMHRINALKGLLSLMVGLVAAPFFAIFAPVAWAAVPPMVIASLAGGHVGVRLARHLNPAGLRLAIIAFGLLVSIRLMV
jgi:uncharacterized membrane protein YfcA